MVYELFVLALSFQEKPPPPLDSDGQPIAKRKPGRPRKIPLPVGGSLHNMYQRFPRQTRGDTTIQLHSSRPESPASDSSDTSTDLSFDDRPGIVPAPDHITQEPLPPVNASVIRVETNTVLDRNAEDKPMEMEVQSRHVDTSVTLKPEPNENLIGLNQHHLELIYQTDNGRLFCGLCAYVSHILACMRGHADLIPSPQPQTGCTGCLL
jgi:hypothetical protein